MNVGKFSNIVARISLVYDDAIHDVVDATDKSRQVTMATLDQNAVTARPSICINVYRVA